MDTIHARVAVYTNSSPFSKNSDLDRRFKQRLTVALFQNSVSSAHFFSDCPRPGCFTLSEALNLCAALLAVRRTEIAAGRLRSVQRLNPCANSREACARRSRGVMPSMWSISLPGIAFSSPCGKISKIFTVCPSILAFAVVKWRAGRALQFFPTLSCSVCW